MQTGLLEDFMKISCLQLNPQTNLQENLSAAVQGVTQAARNGAELVVLPEMFTYMGDTTKTHHHKNTLREGVFAKMQALAQELKIVLVAGSHAETVPQVDRKVYNTSAVFNQNGEMISAYRKVHLFNLKTKDGVPLYCESDVFQEGSDPPVPFSFLAGQDSWSALNMICYDLRFPEVVRRVKTPIDILFVPAAFTWQTGQDHWETLLRARAIENLCYVVGCNQTGFHTENQKRNYGNTMVVDPWGRVVARLGEECGTLTAELSKGVIEECRARLSALGDRRL